MRQFRLPKRYSMMWFMMLGLYFSCAGPGQSPQQISYTEDLSGLRRGEEFKVADATPTPAQPSAEQPTGTTTGTVLARRDVTSQLDNLLTASAEENRKIKSVPGFTIQVYLGTSREAANMAQRQVYMALPDARPEIRFVQPNYRVFVGKFVDRLEAQQMYADLRSEFPNALIIPDRIQIND
ncbi:SPOR domain-containing protein [Cesiribacter andamanensis]|nr:SPOR domain-containing protein [Cesiribacter andamanensis]